MEEVKPKSCSLDCDGYAVADSTQAEGEEAGDVYIS